jgi:predicted acetyltransferase
MNLRKVLVTCNTENIGSARIIQKNGGVFEGESVSPFTGKPVSRYWIEVTT